MSLLRHTLATSVASLIVAGVSGAYALLIARFYGKDSAATDAFFLAYPVYMLAVSFSVTLRVSLVPSMAQAIRAADSSSLQPVYYGISLLFLAIMIIMLLTATPLGNLLAWGAPAPCRDMAAHLLFLFAPVIFLAGISFLYSALLGARGAFEYTAAMMIVSALCGITVFLAAHPIGISSVVLGLLVFNGLLALLLGLKARQLSHPQEMRPPSRIQWLQSLAAARMAIQASSPFLAAHLAYLISQALTASLAQGTPTVFAYAYLLMVMALSATAGSMGLALAPRFGEAAAMGRPHLRACVIQQAARANRIAMAAIGIFAIAAYPFGRLIFSWLPMGLETDPNGRALLLAQIFWVLVPGAWGLSMFSVLAPAIYAVNGQRMLTRLALIALAAHVGIGLVLRCWLGGIGLALGLSFFLATLGVFAALRTGADLGPGTARTLMWRWLMPPRAPRHGGSPPR